MRVARTLTAVLAGGVLAVITAAPALADPTQSPSPSTPASSPAASGTIAVSTNFTTKTAYSGDTVTLTITSRQATEANRDGSFAIYWTGPLTYVSHGASSKCAAEPHYVWCNELTSHILKSDSFTFTVDNITAKSVVKVSVKATSGGTSAKGSVALNVVPAVAGSPSPSASPSAQPSQSASTPPSASPSASPSGSVSGSPSDSPSASPSLTAVGSTGGLPVTGTPLLVIGGLAAALLAAGLGFVLISRRRHNT